MVVAHTHKDVDILVLGATGFTGRLVTRYLCRHPEFRTIKLAIGARSKSRLDDVANSLNLPESSVKRIVVDVLDPESLSVALVGVKVVLNTVGPYWKWGTQVVRVCAGNGIHYVDLTGETHWISTIIQKYDYLASKNRSIIIPSCGFDSVPSDMSAYLGVKTIKTALGEDAEATSSVSSFALSGGISGGTIATTISIFEDVPRDIRNFVATPYALSPVKGPPITGPKFVYSLPLLNKAGSFFPMSPTNRALVQRTWGLSQCTNKKLAYGPNFVYDEFIEGRNRVSSLFVSTVLFLGLGSIALLPPIRWLLKKLLPSGHGPSEEKMSKGFFRVANLTSSSPTAGKSIVHAKSIIKGKGDPGYLLTAIMISEAALLLLTPNKLPLLAKDGGVLTPMTGLGDEYFTRLEATGRFTFESEIISEESRKTR